MRISVWNTIKNNVFSLELLLCCLAIGAQAISKSDLFPYGLQQGDKRLKVGDDVSSSEIQLLVPVAFYDHLHPSIFVNLNGHVSFTTELPAYKSDLILPIGIQVIAPFLADIDTRLSGNVYYRETQDPSLLDLASRQIQSAFQGRHFFQADSLFIVTWDDVGYYDKQYDKTNTFQLILANNGRDSYAVFQYPRDGLNWLRSQGKSSPMYDDVPAQVGFDAGDRIRYHTLPGSGNPDVASLTQWSNINNPGLWIFKTGNVGTNNIESPDDFQQGGEEEKEEPRTCEEGGYLKCGSSAQCTDYSTGFCCECTAPQYGNGLKCLDPGVAQTVNGKVLGNINGYALDSADLHTYILTAEGRTYTAISRVPEELGRSLLSLYTIGSVFGWLFGSTTSPDVKNGFMLTGGDFNRSVVVQFRAGGETVTIKQQFVGADAEGYMRTNMIINGNIPTFSRGAKVEVDEFKEEFTRNGPGVIKSYSTHTFRVDGIPQQLTVDQTIDYKECEANPPRDSQSVRLHVTRSFLIYGDNEQIVRYASNNKVSPAGAASDPCADGSHDCHQEGHCVPTGNGQYRCECKLGYHGDGYSCEDIDECQFGENVHGCHEFAHCRNMPGSHQCECHRGYVGDGRDCRRDQTCADIVCHEQASCVYDSNAGHPMCECNTGFTGDGTYCQPVSFSCNEVNNCDPNADCIWDDVDRQYKCECVDGFSGDGYSCSDTGHREGNCPAPCDANAQCVYDSLILSYTCQCNSGFSGDGYRCESQGCDIMRNCDQNAQCLYDSRDGQYRCMCNDNFRGDGYRCERAGCDVANFCDYNAQCVYDGLLQAYVCRCNDGYVGDGRVCEQDHFNGGVSCNQVNTCDVNAECLYDHATGGHVCRCRQGYQGDGYICDLLGDCGRNPGICDGNARCVRRGNDFVCECNPGYRGDGIRCSSEGDGASYLMFAQGKSILQIPFEPTADNPGQQTLQLKGQTAIGLDVDCYERNLYWTDISGKTIRKAKLDGSDAEIIVSGLGSPEGVAIDWISRNMYWTDSGLDLIQVSQLDGTNKKVLFKENLVNPRAIVVDAANGLMFWSDWNRKEPKIEKAYMDGTKREVMLTENLGLPNGLVIDFETHNICWADAGTMHIECSNYQGRNRRTIYALASYPFGLTYANNVFYWTDWDMKSLPSIDKFGGAVREPMTLPSGGNGRLYGITSVKPHCPSGSNACALNNGGCRFLCLPTPNGGRTCACPSDMNEEECNKIAFLK